MTLLLEAAADPHPPTTVQPAVLGLVSDESTLMTTQPEPQVVGFNWIHIHSVAHNEV